MRPKISNNNKPKLKQIPIHKNLNSKLHIILNPVVRGAICVVDALNLRALPRAVILRPFRTERCKLLIPSNFPLPSSLSVIQISWHKLLNKIYGFTFTFCIIFNLVFPNFFETKIPRFGMSKKLPRNRSVWIHCKMLG